MKQANGMHAVACHWRPGAGLPDWGDVPAIFGGGEPCRLEQAWRAAPEADLFPAHVWTAWNDDGLLVYAELTDRDIVNDVREFNEPSFTVGDAFEIFLRPTGQDAYFEVHLSPWNQKLQLRFPTRLEVIKEARGAAGVSLDEFKVFAPVIESRTRRAVEPPRWDALALLPFAMISECGPVRPGSEWLFSFSRYDHTRGRPQPVLSSTSPHRQLNFHRQEEWGRLVFRAGPGDTR